MAGERLTAAPIGTKAPSITGGLWCRVAAGWQWNGHLPPAAGRGGIYPRPGGDWDGRLIYPVPTPTLKREGQP
ncbi:hypothetical protein Maq22A_1p36260 (plasmid) [Methylobacterium aquaticum]|uniref:Uncharacterized protein n=1 Tax=Methylobacterium aquaticum TaxID=270351 RepID=A0A0C6FQW7_9HYPH|nr:hypothetical protein Maq22A_1p36260 [Methylobacterium aquaticum]